MTPALPRVLATLLGALVLSTPAQAGPDNLTCDAFENELMQFERFQRYTKFGNRGIAGQVGAAIDSGDPRGNPRYADLKASLDMSRHIWDFTESDMAGIRDRADYCKATAAEWETDGDPSNERRRIDQAMSVVEKVYRGAREVRANRTELQEKVDRVLAGSITTDNALDTAKVLNKLNEQHHAVGAAWTIDKIIRPSVVSYESWAEDILTEINGMDPNEISPADLAGPAAVPDILDKTIRLIEADHVIRADESLYRLRDAVRSRLGALRDDFLEIYVARTLPDAAKIDGTPVDVQTATLRAYAEAYHAAEDLRAQAPQVWQPMEDALHDVVQERRAQEEAYLCEQQIAQLIEAGIDLHREVFNGRRRFVPLGRIACHIAGAGFEIDIQDNDSAPDFDGPTIRLRAEPAFDRVSFGEFGRFEYMEITFVQGHPARSSAYQARHIRDNMRGGPVNRRVWSHVYRSFRTEIRMGWPEM